MDSTKDKTVQLLHKDLSLPLHGIQQPALEKERYHLSLHWNP